MTKYQRVFNKENARDERTDRLSQENTHELLCNWFHF